MKTTQAERRAIDAIDQRLDFVYDIAAEYGQILDNVAHMRWFVRAVAEAMDEGE